VTEDLKYRMVDEIARDNNCLKQNVLAIEYYPDWQEVQVHFSILWSM
jgi:vacuolar protein sorting-associated protein IST1